MKILYVTTVASTMFFFPAHIKMLQDAGHTVEMAANLTSPLTPAVPDFNCKFHQIDFSRSPLSADNKRAYRQLKELLNNGHYDIVHTHTPNASAMVRFAAIKMRKKGMRVLYTAHGFHFYKGAPAKNWLLYYPMEWLCAHWTDTLITINKEDYVRAQRHMHAKKVEYVPGVGLNLSRFQNLQIDRAAIRKEVGIPDQAPLLLSVGELNLNKNHQIVIHALARMGRPDVHYMIAGEGDNKQALIDFAKQMGVEKQVHLMGYRTDIPELLHVADAYILPSIREGLNVSLMEAMASGLPCACSRIRGNVDLIDSKGGVLFNPQSVEGVKEAMQEILSCDFKAMGDYNARKVQNFSCEKVLDQLHRIYGI